MQNDRLIDGALLGDLMRKHLTAIKSGMVEAMAQKGRNASMRSVESLEIIADDMHGEIRGLKSWLAMERGHRGGKVPASFYAIILQWAINKGIRVDPMPYKTDRPHKYTPERRALMSFAWVVSQRIAREGTVLYREQGFDDIYSSIMERELDEMQKELVVLCETSVQSINRNLSMKK